MFGNLPFVRSVKKLFTSKNTIHLESLPTFYDLYNEQHQRPWEIIIDNFDFKKVKFAIEHSTPVPISEGLTDVQLLKLHADSFPEYDNQLIYHEMFDLFEVKYKQETIAIFSYREGKYTPIDSIF